jgi:hypothetical protein
MSWELRVMGGGGSLVIIGVWAGDAIEHYGTL